MRLGIFISDDMSSSPSPDTRDVSNLMGRAGFTLLTVDIDEIKVAYPSMFELMEDLQAMGENNAVIGRRNYACRDTLAAASSIYQGWHLGVEQSVVYLSQPTQHCMEMTTAQYQQRFK